VDLGDLRLVSRHAHPVPASETAAASAALGTALPEGYAAHVERYGPGLTCEVVRVVVPRDLEERTAEWRDRITEYWFWETDAVGVTPADLQTRGVVVADTLDGDELCFVAGAPERLFLLPRHSDDAIAFDDGFLPAVRWVLEQYGAGLPVFESFVGRQRFEMWGRGVDGEAVAADLLALGLHDLERVSDAALDLLVPSLGASVRLDVSAMGVRASGTYDEDAPAADLDRFFAVLTGHGLRLLQQ
jgi:hypothetical protein